MRSFVQFTILMGLLAPSSAFTAEDEIEHLMALLAQRTHGHVSFVEEDHVAMLDRPLHSSGELLYDRPDRLEKRTLVPRAASVLLEGGNVTIQSRGHKRVLALLDYPQLAPFAESLRATLAGDRAALEKAFRLTFEGTIDSWVLILAPREVKLKNLVQQIRIEGAQEALRSVKVVQADGDDSVMTIGSALPP